MRNNSYVTFDDAISTYKLGKEYFNRTLIDNWTSPMHKDVQLRNFKIMIKEPNNYYILRDESVVMVENICHLNNVAIIIDKKLKNGKPFFHLPAPSTCFGIIKFSQEYSGLQAFSIRDIKNKAILLPIFDPSDRTEGRHKNVVAFPLIHGYNL